MKISKSRRNNIIFLGLIIILLIPQTRMPIQVLLHKGLALFGVSVIDEEDRDVIAFEDWTLINREDESFNFKSFEDEVIFLNIWATWCPPCIAEMPSIQALHNDYNTKVRFVIISNESPEVIEAFMNDKGYDFEVFRSAQAYPKPFNVSSIPRTFIIDKNGKIVVDKGGAANWNSNSVRDLLDGLLLD